MQIEVLLTPNVWLQASPEVRNTLAREFDTVRSSSPRCVTEMGITRVESDGFTIDDLRAFNVESMQKWLGFAEIDPSADLNALFEMCANRVEDGIIVRNVQATNTLSPVVGEVVTPVTESKRFCDQCDSKGVRHLKICPKFK